MRFSFFGDMMLILLRLKLGCLIIFDRVIMRWLRIIIIFFGGMDVLCCVEMDMVWLICIVIVIGWWLLLE